MSDSLTLSSTRIDVGIRQADDGLPLANDGAFLDDEVVAAQVLPVVGVGDNAVLGRGDRAVGDLLVDLRELLHRHVVALLVRLPFGLGDDDVALELLEHLGLGVLVEHLELGLGGVELLGRFLDGELVGLELQLD